MMKTIIISLLLFFTVNAQNYLLILSDNEVSVEQVLVDSYITRVELDGGTVIDESAVLSAIQDAVLNSYWDSVKIWVSADFGVKRDANNKTTKLYGLKGIDIVQSDTSKTGTWVASGQNSKPYIQIDGGNDIITAESGVAIISVHSVFNPYPAIAYEGFMGSPLTNIFVRSDVVNVLLYNADPIFGNPTTGNNTKINGTQTSTFIANAYSIFETYGATSTTQTITLGWGKDASFSILKFSEFIATNLNTKQVEIRGYLNSKYAIY